MNVLDVGALRRAEIVHEPFTWGSVARSFLGTDVARHLADTFPDDGFEWHAQRQLLLALGKGRSTDARKHAVRTRALIARGNEELVERESLPEIWQAVGEDLFCDEYRQAISECTGRDVRWCPMQTHFWRYEPGSWFEPHVDKSHKIVTHLIYLNDGWDRDWGGCLRILNSSDINDVACELTPDAGRGAILVQSKRSWHAVSELEPGHGARKVLQTWFWG